MDKLLEQLSKIPIYGCNMPFSADIDEKNTRKVDMPEKYIINENVTVLIWKNGEKTIVRRCENDEFNPRLAFLTAFFQHYCGMSKNKANRYLASLEIEKPKEIKSKSINEYVKIVDAGETYDTYIDLIKKYFSKYTNNFIMHDIPNRRKKYKVLGKIYHEHQKYVEVYLIQDEKTEQVYLISKKGIKEV